MTATKYKSIILKPHEVVGILERRQTQLRRILKPQPVGQWVFQEDDGTWHEAWESAETDSYGGPLREERRPLKLPYTPGDIVYGRETWASPEDDKTKPGRVAYDADGRCGCWIGDEFLAHGRILEASGYSACFPPQGADTYGLSKYSDIRSGEYPSYKYGWRSSVHMPQWAARIWLRIGEVKVQRVQDIDPQDAHEEGLTPWKSDRLFADLPIGCYRDLYGSGGFCNSYGEPDYEIYVEQQEEAILDGFRQFWEHIHGSGAWERNDWTVVYQIEAVERPEDV